MVWIFHRVHVCGRQAIIISNNIRIKLFIIYQPVNDCPPCVQGDFSKKMLLLIGSFLNLINAENYARK